VLARYNGDLRHQPCEFRARCPCGTDGHDHSLSLRFITGIIGLELLSAAQVMHHNKLSEAEKLQAAFA